MKAEESVDAEDTSDLTKELDGLVGLAESSATSIDQLATKLDGLYLLVATTFLTGLYFFATSAGMLSGSNSEGESLNSMHISFIFSLAIAIVHLYQRRILPAKNRLRAELDILNRLLSLIDQQMRRIEGYGAMSPVAQATFEIRIRRLNRG